MNTGEIIKMLRKEKGLTQTQLGEIVGVQKSAINKYENGSIENLKRTTIEKLANYFGVSPSYIMGLDDNRNKNDLLAKLLKENEFTSEEVNEINNYIKYLISKRGSTNG